MRAEGTGSSGAEAANLRDQQRAFREQAIVDEAGRLLAEIGCDAMNMEQVAARLGTSKAALYRHFTSKEQLLRRAVGEAIGEALRRAREAARDVPPEDALREAARSLVRSWLEGRTVDAGSRAAPCCLALVECPYADWGETRALWADLRRARGPGSAPTREAIELTRVLRALTAVAVSDIRAQGRASGEQDVQAVVDYLFEPE